MDRLDEWLVCLQKTTALAMLPFLVWYYRRFLAGLLKFATRYPGLTVVLVVLYLMVYGLLGADLGIPYLFWHDDFWVRASTSTGATMLLAVVGVIAYHLDPYPWATGRRTAEFLRADEQIKGRVEGWYARRLTMALPRRDGAPGVAVKPRPWDYLTFGLNTIIDPIAITPVQLLLEPDQEHSLRLQRFLRAARGPFLLLLLAPALLPGFFSLVPRAAPTGKLGLEGLLGREAPPTYDVSRHPEGYLIGLAAWLMGIQAGVLTIKAFVRFSTLLHDGRVPDAISRLLASVGDGLRRSRGMVWVRAAWGRAGDALGADPTRDSTSQGPPELPCPNASAGACRGSGCPRGEPFGGPSSISRSPASGQLRGAAIVFALLFLATYALLGFLRYLGETLEFPLFELPPAFAICVLLAILAMGYATIAYLPRPWRIPIVLLLVAWFGYANSNPFKNRFERISYEKGDLADLRGRSFEAYGKKQVDPMPLAQQVAPAPLVNDVHALEAWKAEASLGGPELKADLDREGRPKLVVVAVSGGATRSAYWTAVVLDRLEQTLGPSFGRRVRIIAGASGGMLGAACYVTYRRWVAEGTSTDRAGAPPKPDPGSEPTSVLPRWIRDDLPKRSMDPLARQIALAELWNAAWPGTVREDRGVILEKDWQVLRYPFVVLGALEAGGKIPSIIFSPMIVEDGRRLLISNLELSRGDDGWASSPIIEAAGRQVNQSEFALDVVNDGTAHLRYSLSSLEYFRIFPEKAHRDLLLSTAVRMSASFPFVSPAVHLPTNPPRRVVDAGYYDNYGIQVATAWIRRHHRWLARNTSGVLLVQIRDSSSYLDRRGVNTSAPSSLESASRGFQFLTSPIDAVAKARYTTASFRNDSDVAALDSFQWEFRDKAGEPYQPAKPESFFTTVIFENSAAVSLDPDDFWDVLTRLFHKRPVKRDFREVSMSWYLARAEMSATAAAIPGDPPTARPGDPDWNDPRQRLEMIKRLNDDSSDLTAVVDRAILLKRLDQLYNYEGLINLKKWWNRGDP